MVLSAVFFLFFFVIPCFPDANKNKAGYTATPVACEWAGAVLRSLDHLGRGSEAKDHKKSKVWRTVGRTDRRTDGPTKRGVESRSTRLKSNSVFTIFNSIITDVSVVCLALRNTLIR